MCNEEEKDMSTNTLEIPKTVHKNIIRALKEVELIQSGKLPKKTAREFLAEQRNK